MKDPLIMGVLNVTPDSFSDGGRYFDSSAAVDHALKMSQDGADIIDVGGESSRPGSDSVSPDEELRRVIPVIEGIRKKSKINISIDTTKSRVARRAIEAGASMINDISAGRFDPDMFAVAASFGVPVCLMHMKGTPKDMQDDPRYEDVVGEIASFLRERCIVAEREGIAPERIIIDPGIGFGKTAEDNLRIINELEKLKVLGKKILIGTSNKSFIGRVLGLTVDKRLEATLATLGVAYQKGASIFRVHDAGAAKRYLSMMQQLGGFI